MIFFIYQLSISIILIFSPIIIIYRIFKNKEDKFRVKEKFCFFSKKGMQANSSGFTVLVSVK